MNKGKDYKFLVKRAFDITGGIVGLIVLSPAIVITAIAVRVKLGSPIFFTQERIGLNNKTFKMIKFRTMKNSKDKEGNLLSDEERLTKTGKFIRSLSLDETPELINVIKGDMSLVGPRPLLVEYLPLYSEIQIKRHDVMPGITGWAQINGRNAISWTKRFELDVFYVENCSLLLDFKILFLTFVKVFKREGISQVGNATMEKFNGHN
ncbi:sugar transferase [Clostridium tarantellae]|uniref:Sugar transferase n=1 Tax=Clostridium tarantellae TaxID=39493 RepID=A0A6I1MGI4_9CLOT|nr:sugar transferase [Clostridium tarantellae]